MRPAGVAAGAAAALWAGGALAQVEGDAIELRCDGRGGLTVLRARFDRLPSHETVPAGAAVEAVASTGSTPVRVRVACGALAPPPATAPVAPPRIHMAPLRKAGLVLGVITGAGASLFLAATIVSMRSRACDVGSSGACSPGTATTSHLVASTLVMAGASVTGFLLLALGARVPAETERRVSWWVAPAVDGASAGLVGRF